MSVRLCMSCSNTLFAKRDFAAELAAPPPAYVRAYATLVSFWTGIQEQMPRLQRLIEDGGPDPAQLVEAVKVKRRIVESLARVDAIAKAIVSGGAGASGVGGMEARGGAGGAIEGTGGAAGGAEARIRNNIALATANWGREVGLRVKTLTTALDGAVAAARPSAREEVLARLGKTLPPAQLNGHVPSPPGRGRGRDLVATGATGARKPMQGVVGEDEKKHESEKEKKRNKIREKEDEGEDEEGDSAIRETIVVLEEQKFLLLQMLQDAKRRRRFDEVDALNRSLEEIEHEVEALGGGVVGV